ncbi:unnamed protein product [Cuscuta campestris]|uniref:Pectinesterase inhibitor domain-containing protein n=1 Tax=Cuscuta campestris TaxID=132261 RepID=A0A484LLH7_9ASTE|nr:unnamed protein product [Cuscuta campestris]
MVSISAAIPITLCLLIFSAKPNTCQKTIEALCAKTIDPGFCRRVLAASPTQSPDGLLKAAVSQAAADAVATDDIIKSLLNQPNDPNLVAYFQCSNYYSAAVAALDAASQLLGSRPAADVKNDVASAAMTVQKDGDRCKASFDNGAKHALSSENRRLKIHGNIISVVCDAI